MAGIETLRQVREFNTDQIEADLDDQMERLADSIDGDGRKGPRADREHVPVEMWRALRQ